MTPQLLQEYAQIMRALGVTEFIFGDVKIVLPAPTEPTHTVVIPPSVSTPPTPPAQEPSDEDILLGYFNGRQDIEKE